MAIKKKCLLFENQDYYKYYNYFGLFNILIKAFEKKDGIIIIYLWTVFIIAIIINLMKEIVYEMIYKEIR